MTKRTADRARLSTRLTFVIHLGAADPKKGLLEGRIEHLASGRARRFNDGHELLAFLAEAHDPAAGSAGGPRRDRRR